MSIHDEKQPVRKRTLAEVEEVLLARIERVREELEELRARQKFYNGQLEIMISMKEELFG